MCVFAVESLGWVTLGAATEGVTPIFFLKNLSTFFYSPIMRCHPCLFSPEKLMTFFCSSLSLFIDFTWVLPPGGCHPALFLPVPPRFSTILSKFAHKFFFLWVSPPWRVSPPLRGRHCVFMRCIVRQQFVNLLAHSVCVQDDVLAVDTAQADGSVVFEVA